MIPTDLAATAVLALGALVGAASLLGLALRLVQRGRSLSAQVVELGPEQATIRFESPHVPPASAPPHVVTRLELLVGDVIRVRPKGDAYAPVLTPRVRLALPFLAYGIALMLVSTWLRDLDIDAVFWVLPAVGCVLAALLFLYVGYLAGRIAFVVGSHRVQARIVEFRDHPNRGERNQSYQARVEYDVDGRIRRAWSPAMYYTSFRTGRTVKLYVDRMNPANVVTLGLAPLIIGIIVLALPIGFVVLPWLLFRLMVP